MYNNMIFYARRRLMRKITDAFKIYARAFSVLAAAMLAVLCTACGSTAAVESAETG